MYTSSRRKAIPFEKQQKKKKKRERKLRNAANADCNQRNATQQVVLSVHVNFDSCAS